MKWFYSAKYFLLFLKCKITLNSVSVFNFYHTVTYRTSLRYPFDWLCKFFHNFFTHSGITKTAIVK